MFLGLHQRCWDPVVWADPEQAGGQSRDHDPHTISDRNPGGIQVSQANRGIQTQAIMSLFRDPRSRMLQQQQERKISGPKQPDGAKLSFQEKMKLFAQEVGFALRSITTSINDWCCNLQAGETTPRDKAKISKAQREIDDWEIGNISTRSVIVVDKLLMKNIRLETLYLNQSLLLQHLYKHMVQVQ